MKMGEGEPEIISAALTAPPGLNPLSLSAPYPSFGPGSEHCSLLSKPHCEDAAPQNAHRRAELYLEDGHLDEARQFTIRSCEAGDDASCDLLRHIEE